ncbi:CpaF/VirB11 family protein, partial [Candidatus Micrarchaeota archaeon]|nr:CpaF/VirB11 family protein [Candidatus Micrarchaeota archaeon]
DYNGMAFLSMLMQSDSSVIIAGNTASGKTTTLNALFSFIPKNERVVITEETPEINVPHEQQVRLVANKDIGITLKDLVYDSLRMRPDRIIVGEVRNAEEVEALFDVMLGGQARGTYATFHAQSVHEGLLRMKKFGINDMDLRSIDVMVVQRRMLKYYGKSGGAKEERKITEICGVGEKVERISWLDCGRWKYERGAAHLRLAESLGLSAKELDEEILNRAKWMKKTECEFDGFFAAVQKHMFRL